MSESDFMRAICEQPADDLPRLMLADWLEEQAGDVECPTCGGCKEIGCDGCEGAGIYYDPPYSLNRKECRQCHGEGVLGQCPTCSGSGRVSDGRRERAEFVRCQVRLEELLSTQEQREAPCPENAEIYHLRKQERKLLAGWGKQWFSEWAVFGNSSANLDRDQSMFRVPIAKVERGFVSAVSAPLAVLVGGPCERCGGQGYLHNDMHYSNDPCPAKCRDGQIPGIASRLIGVMPVEVWVATDKEPFPDFGESRWSWWNQQDHHNPEPRGIPTRVWGILKGYTVFRGEPTMTKWWDTKAEAIVALSQAISAIAREQSAKAKPSPALALDPRTFQPLLA